MENFKIISLKVQKNPFLKDLEINFINENELRYGPYFSVLIGPNGTGKSFILKLIIDIFRDLENHKNGKTSKLVNGFYEIIYLINGKHVTYLSKINKKNIKPNIIVNNRKINIKDIPLPNKVLAVSSMLNDRFPFVNDANSGIYKYMGIRRSTSTATTKSYIKRTTDFLLDHLRSNKYSKILKKTLLFLGYEFNIRIVYDMKFRSKIFNGKLTEKKFKDFFINWKKYRKRRTEPYVIHTYKSLVKKGLDISSLVNFINRTYKRSFASFEKNVIGYNILKEHTNQWRDLKYLRILNSLDLISSPQVIVRKSTNKFPLASSSSGEFHFLSTILGIITNIKDNSIILIDEPEISLHPNWQIKYINFLYNLLSEYKSCHFLIATHSHFIISDLRQKKSSIISLKYDEKNNVCPKRIDLNTFGWSAEQILLEIFNTPTTRNYYIADKVGEILEMLSKVRRNDEDIKAKVKKLLDRNIIALSSEDPLKPVINRLIEKYA